jgi:hypothetical protein
VESDICSGKVVLLAVAWGAWDEYWGLGVEGVSLSGGCIFDWSWKQVSSPVFC